MPRDWHDPEESPPPGRNLRFLALWLAIFVAVIGGAKYYDAWHDRRYPGTLSWIDQHAFFGRGRSAALAQPDPETQLDAAHAQFNDLGYSSQGLAEIAQELRAMGDEAGALMLDAYARSEAGDAEGAMRLADQGVALNPGAPDFWSAHAEMALALNRFDVALASYRRASALAPTRFDFRRRAAIVLAEMGDIPAARAELDAVLAQSPPFVAARIRRAALRLAVGDLAGAGADLDQGIAEGLGPEDADDIVLGTGKLAELFTCRGLLRSQTAPGADIIADFRAAAQADPRYGETRLARFLTERRLQMASPAVPAAWDGEDNGAIGVKLINLYRGVGDPGEVLARIPDRPYFGRRADISVAHYYLGEWRAMNGETDAARQHFRTALAEGAPHVCEFGLARLRLAELGG